MRQVSLLDWISAKDSQSDVRQIAQLCCRGLAQISEGLLEQVGQEVSAVLREADRPQMKEVKGLGERLCGLEQLMHDAAYVVQEQSNFSQILLHISLHKLPPHFSFLTNLPPCSLHFLSNPEYPASLAS
ncbi:uncharacterized protein LOC135097270 [Scylla paramamosain]|uniref:uncharacterized protein LOC135097270 n=1 Tax=Scylla paramamosain TaxID=85552 RepID=UPI003083D5F3